MSAVNTRLIATALAVLAAGGVSTSSLAHSTGPATIRIVEPGTTFFERSYNRLAGQWWNWALKEPDATSPLTDTSGEDCARNQVGPVWFLAGTFFGPAVERSCTVPAGKAIFFPFANTVSVHPDNTKGDVSNRCTFSGRYDLSTIAGRLGGVRCDANDDLIGDEISGNDVVYRFVNLKVTIDDLRTPVSPDVRVSDPYAYRAQSQPGGYTQYIPPGSVLTELLGVNAGPRYPAVADGYWIFLKPLPVGQYTIHFEATDRLSKSKVIDVTYNLEVK